MKLSGAACASAAASGNGTAWQVAAAGIDNQATACGKSEWRLVTSKRQRGVAKKPTAVDRVISGGMALNGERRDCRAHAYADASYHLPRRYCRYRRIPSLAASPLYAHATSPPAFACCLLAVRAAACRYGAACSVASAMA